MITRILVALALAASAAISFGQAVGGNGVPGANSGSATIPATGGVLATSGTSGAAQAATASQIQAAILGTTISPANDIPSQTPVIDARFYGVSTGASDNTADINTAIAAAISANACLFFPPGVYQHATAISVTLTAGQTLCMEGKNRQSRFKYTGTTTTSAWTFIGNYSANQPSFQLSNLMFDANGLASYAWTGNDSIHGKYLYLSATNATVAGFYCLSCDTDIWIAPVVSQYQESYTTRPEYAMILDTGGAGGEGNSSDETIIDPSFEYLSTAGLWMKAATNSTVIGGTIEGGGGIGILCDTLCDDDKFIGQDIESNTGYDISCVGKYDTFSPAVAVSTNGLNLASGCIGANVTSGNFSTIVVSSGASGNKIHEITLTSAISDSGTSTQYWNMLNPSTNLNWAGNTSYLACASRGLGDGKNAIAAATYKQTTCYNNSGTTFTITGVKCYVDAGSSSTLNATDNSANALLTGAITCSSSYAAGTVSGTHFTIAAGGYVEFTFVADGTATQTDWEVTGTQ